MSKAHSESSRPESSRSHRLTYQRERIPGGQLTVIVDPDADCVVYATFLQPRTHMAKRPDLLRKHTHPTVRAALLAYADGDLSPMDAVAVAQPGSDFRQRAWQAMREVPAGGVITYAELARRIGNPGAARAAGTSCSTNQIPIFVPCHRIVGAQGLGGYAFGLSVKQQLLRHEGWLAH